MINLNIQFNYANLAMHFVLSVKKGEKIALVGASGAGKSTLLNLIAGFESPKSGSIFLNGQDCTFLSPAQRPVSMLFQENNLFTHLNVAENLALGIKPSLKLNAQEKDAVLQASQAVGLEAFLTRKPSELSGGQKQRVALARCLLRNQPILLLDEPFSALDPNLRQEMLHLIARFCQEKQLTLLMVTHQVDEVKNVVDKVLRVENGQLVQG